MKVAQYTLNGNFNLGSMLQKYALHKTLQKFSDSAEVLFPEQENFYSETGLLPQEIVPKFPDVTEQTKAVFRQVVWFHKFKEFENRYIKTRFDIPYFEEIADDYDFFVVGSDQVWNPTWFQVAYFLPFVPSEKKIAYAASVASPKIPDEVKEIYAKAVSSFGKISVREPGAVEMLEEITGRKIEWVLDPVFLLSAEDWKKIAERPSWFNEKYSRGYILTYYLRSFPPPEIKTLAQKLNLPVINLLDLNNYWHYVVGPAEFLFLIANAKLFVTNSFHGTAFATIFKTNFVVRDSEIDKAAPGMSLRILGLLKVFGLEDRIFLPENNFETEKIFETDFTMLEKNLPTEKARSLKFLTDAIQGGGIVVYEVKNFYGGIFFETCSADNKCLRQLRKYFAEVRAA